MNTVLFVCWEAPTKFQHADEPVLSFMPPAMEDKFVQEYRGPVIYAREASLVIKKEARELYLNIVPKIGIVPVRGKGTFRKSLTRKGQASQWWYHPVAFKDCESDPTFNHIITILTIQSTAQELSVKRLVFVGAPWEVVAVMKTAFEIEEVNTKPPPPKWRLWFSGFGSRVKYLLTSLRHLFACRRCLKLPEGSYDVVFSGFWDWSVWMDEDTQTMRDQYFGRLPLELKTRNTQSVGWFAWFDPHAKPGEKKKKLKDILAPLYHRNDVVILQAFLNALDIFRALSDFRALLEFINVRNKKEFREIFKTDRFDFYPLFARPLTLGFINASIPHCELVALATTRSSLRYRPKVTLSFLEHFPYSRAHYEGIRRANCKTTCFAVQHASYNHEKTFLFLHPKIELKGHLDGCAVPHPDHVYVMGIIGRDLFLECGYSPQQVNLTGSPRYDHVRLSAPRSKKRFEQKEEIVVLLACSLDVSQEIDMVEAACLAAQGLSKVRIRLRNHPFARVDAHPRFEQWRGRLEVSKNSLAEDLAQIDVVLFSHSTVAEEAFLLGKPVWQWLPNGFNGSALAEAIDFPKFGSVSDLRKAFIDICSVPERFIPSPSQIKRASKRLFYPADGLAAARIAVSCQNFLSTIRLFETGS